MISAHVSWPSAPLTESLVRRALCGLSIPVKFIGEDELSNAQRPLQWSTYDEIDHGLTLAKRDSLLVSSYSFRKALIRKHFLSRVIQTYLKKKPESILKWACPRTFELEICFADELDEMWTDELWELGTELDAGTSWWILKPGMADRGMGIRIFHTKRDLQDIFESFEIDSEEEGEIEQNATTVVASQLRHFVIQEYLQNPLLLDPTENVNRKEQVGLTSRKFHLRAYCVSSGDIKLYLYTRVLALFSSAPYLPLSVVRESDQLDLRPHLTNTSLQTGFGENNVRLLDELEGCHSLSGEDKDMVLSRLHINDLMKQMSEVLAEVFKAALQNPVHFQPLPNAFELFGVDFLVSHIPGTTTNPFQIKILEINSEPAIELTGPRLTWVLEDLFASIAKVCVEPFFIGDRELEDWTLGETKHNLLKCLDHALRPRT